MKEGQWAHFRGGSDWAQRQRGSRLIVQPARRTLATAPEPQRITAELLAAAKKEGRVAYYTSVELPVAEKVAKAFEAKFPGIAVRVERSGAERNFQRIT